MARKVLIVDDKANVRVLVADYLRAEGYEVISAENGKVALRRARQEKPDLILLDIMMPEMDGYEFVRIYRAESSTPIILLTAKLEELDKVVGLELGADDYVTKPFGMRELVARIRAVMRRVSPGEADNLAGKVLRAADVMLDQNSHTVKVANEPVSLTPSEYDLLAILMATPGRVYTRINLLERTQGVAFEGVERTIDVHIHNLRQKIEPNPSKPVYIETVPSVGYRFSAE